MAERFWHHDLHHTVADGWDVEEFPENEREVMLPETNIARKNGGPLEKQIPIGNHHFRDHVSFREGNNLPTNTLSTGVDMFLSIGLRFIL